MVAPGKTWAHGNDVLENQKNIFQRISLGNTIESGYGNGNMEDLTEICWEDHTFSSV